LEENDYVLQKKTTTAEADCNAQQLDEEKDDSSSPESSKFVRKGTFKIDKSKSKSATENGANVSKKLRDQEINIKMKEELIKELVANSKMTNRINQQYQHQIELLQKECNQLKHEILEIQHFNTNTNINKDAQLAAKPDSEYKKRLELSLLKIAELEAKQKESEKYISTMTASEKKVTELELALGKLKQQNEALMKKIKDDQDKKLKLEKEYERGQQTLKDLEAKSEQQQKILKKKTEDLANAQRRLRSASNSNLNATANTTNNAITNQPPDDSALKQQHWLKTN
jgi:chromosome segregation ATPase